MNFTQKRKLDARRTVVNANIKLLDAGFRALKSEQGFAATRLTRHSGDCSMTRANMAAEKMKLGASLPQDTAYAYCGMIKKSPQTMPSSIAVYWNANRPQDRELVVASMKAQGLTILNEDRHNETVIVELEPAA